MLAVTVNDRPVGVSAIVERGRVLLPLRAAFTALGATVSYDDRARVVVAHYAQRIVRFPLRSVRVIASRSYMPLRAAAQAFGASVVYDAQAHTVRVWLHSAIAAAHSGLPVTSLNPAADAVVDTAYPTISASLGSAQAAGSTVELTVDGQNVTALATFDGSTITFMPRTGLARGSHTVVFAGRTLQGDAFNKSWSFSTTVTAPPDSAPGFSSPHDYRFYVNGANRFYPGDWMHFTLIAPPGGSAVLQLCNLGYQYPFWNGDYGTTYEANVQAPNGYWLPACQVTAIYTSWSGVRTYLPVPVTIGLFTAPAATPSPRPTIGTRPVPSSPRKPEPSPSPAPVHIPTPGRTPAPVPPTAPIHIAPPVHVPVRPHPRATAKS